jgi:MFS transporter, ACS family, solute carrier family 17 (sodium-dependent inorganic phosphate cotransporter), other
MFVGALSALGLSGVIIDAFSWEMVFYIFGTVGCLWYIIWLLGASKTPETDRFINDRERRYIMHVLNQKENEEIKVNIPWRSILTSKPVWGIFVAQFAFTWGLYTLLTQLPTFFARKIFFCSFF